ncbi:MAG: FAD-dependent oxidoreductase, partial [Bacteroidota bacterium]
TTGYEEAASQGMMAGLNAALKNRDEAPLVLKRDEAYIGVLIDDLVNKGTEEPYRMFTSRAEYRILLRQDNADLRLTEMSHKLGFADEKRNARAVEKREGVAAIQEIMARVSVTPAQMDGILEAAGTTRLKQTVKAESIIGRPGITLAHLAEGSPELKAEFERFDIETLEQAEIQVKYRGYIRKERELAEKMVRLDDIRLPDTFNYHKVTALSYEGREKLSRVRPSSLGQASRISGVTPADISVLMIFIGR